MISREGYAEATTSRVIAEAGVSRGALLHHFPSKADLMVAAAEAVYRRHVKVYAALVGPGGELAERMDRLFDAAWSVHVTEDTSALIEIWMATRGDAELKGKFEAFQQRSYEQGGLRLTGLFPEAGFTPEAARDWLVLFSAALRGLAIERTMGRDPSRLDGPVALLRSMMRLALARPELTGRSDGIS